jgi:hypothetical protein
MGIYPHTVMYYDLRGPAPVYDNKDFSALYAWMLSMIDGVRKVYYYPETAYWCSFDIDVPSFLPVYAFNRWKDLNLLVDKGLDGHVDFTSGHEWGYWLSDWAVARYTWNSRRVWTEALDRLADVFGAAGPSVAASIRDLALTQEEFLIGRNLASYLAGEDTWDELGYLFGTTTHPQPLRFAELYKMDEAGVRRFAATTLADLEAMKEEFGALLGRIQDACARSALAGQPWCGELADGFRVDAERASHAYHLWAGACARRLNELGVQPDGESVAQSHFTQARALTREFRQTVKQREAHYRYPLLYSIGWKRSVTSYDYRYLYQASNAYWLRRYERQAIDKNFNPFLMNLVDPIWFFF